MTVRVKVLLAAMAVTASTLVATAQEAARLATEVLPEAGQPTLQPADATAAIRALLADPTIRESVGLAENAYDVNAPDGVPGFGPIDSTADRRLARVGTK